jgi:hypothetical protein
MRGYNYINIPKRGEEFEVYPEGGYISVSRRGQCPASVRFMSFPQRTDMLKMLGTSVFKIMCDQGYPKDSEDGQELIPFLEDAEHGTTKVIKKETNLVGCL